MTEHIATTSPSEVAGMLAIRPASILGFLWVGLYAVYVYAYNFTIMPNQIFWSYVLIFFIYSAITLLKKKALFEALKPVVAYWIYLAAFYIVSYWELVPGTSVRHLPFHSLEWLVIFAFFAIGYQLSVVKQCRVYVVMAKLIVLWTALQFFLFPDVPRFGYGSLAMLLLPLLLAYRQFWTFALLLLFMFGSAHVTPLVAGGAASLVYLLVFYRFNLLEAVRQHLRLLVIFLFVMAAALPVLWAKVVNTLNRLMSIDGSLVGQDWLREYIIENSWRMLVETKGLGIGYMNFYAWSGLDTGYSHVTRTGSIIEGFNIHNTFMTWALEGGVLVILSVVFLGYLTSKRIRLIYKNDRKYGAVLVGMIAAFLVFAMAHQLHMLTQFWAFIGLVWGYSFRLQSECLITDSRTDLLPAVLLTQSCKVRGSFK